MKRESENPDLLCYCAGVTRSALRDYLREPGANMAAYIDRTGLAKKCTACALDLDLLLDEELATRPKLGADADVGASTGRRWLTYPVRRIDSGFFINRDGVRTTLRVGNYHPPFDDPRGIAPQRYKVETFDADGRRGETYRGEIAKGGSLSLCFADRQRAVAQGWFLLSVWSTHSAHAGTIRPQVALSGPGWTTSYHTQFHMYASRAGRRSGVQLRTRAGRTRAGVSIINAGGRASPYRVVMEAGGAPTTVDGRLPAYGSDIVMIDDLFPELPDDAPVVARFESEQPTRKNVVFFGEDGRISVDHFPNLI